MDEKGIDEASLKKSQAEELRKMIKEVVIKMGPAASKEDKQVQAKVLLKVLEQGVAPKDALNFSKKDMVEIYSFAYSQFSGGKYREAAELFKMLMMLDPQEVDFVTGLGVCYHRLKNYPDALKAYMLSSILAPDDPVPLFYAYDCCKNLNELGSAGMLLSKLIKLAGTQPKYAKLKANAEVLLAGLEKELLTHK